MLEEFITSLYSVTYEMAPYLLFGFLMAGIFSVIIPKELVEKHLGKDKIWSIIKASCFGVPLPLCSCSVIPVAATIKNKGASNGATTAFLISTPQTGVDSFFVSYAMLGPIFAIYTPIVAFISGIFGGTLVNIFAKEQNQTPTIEEESTCCSSCCSEKKDQQNIFARIFRHGFIEIPKDIAKPLIVGIAIASFLSAILPSNFFSGYLGTGISGMLIMMLLGMPLYVCATASIPIAAALISKGVDPGAAFVFLMSGPATNAATITTIWKLMGKNTVIVYLIAILACALLFGLLLNTIHITTSLPVMDHMQYEPTNIFNLVCALALVLILLNTFLSK